MSRLLDYHQLKNLDLGSTTQTYTERDTMLYALSVGVGADPLDERQLGFVYERGLRALPSMVTVLGAPAGAWSMQNVGIDWTRVLHGEERIELLQPLPVSGTVRATNRIVALSDKGPARGAVLTRERALYDDAASGALLARITQVLMLRGNGGFSASSSLSDPSPPLLPAVPASAPDSEVELASLPQAALLYRLNGDVNPLHVDPAVARAAGFERPILHGLCSFGMAVHAALRGCCDYDAARIRSVAARFTSPVYPGERVTFQFWRGDNDRLHFRARVPARDVTVLDRGLIGLQ
ncbi:MAG TPA: MaoC/PaaZ C-terminal domain-containing protein [Steroidobacteraceae bacterium]|jgi:acyl dehydratase|nr:MaoC/PaaZ C-terminal domain-containing protein [Steroidobacteraceae bacterium]